MEGAAGCGEGGGVMACPHCGCKTTYQYDDSDDECLERCAACGEVFGIEDHADEEE